MSAQNLDHFKKIYFEECFELLMNAENQLMDLSADENPTNYLESIHAIFRCIHSIKGGGGTFGFTDLVNFAHAYETLLDYLRDERIHLTHDLVTLMLRANDLLEDLATNAKEEDEVRPHGFDELLDLLKQAVDAQGHGKEVNQGGNTNTLISHENILDTNVTKVVTFIPKPNLMRYGNEPLLILRELKRLVNDFNPDGSEDFFKVECLVESLPSLDNFISGECYLTWKITIQGNCPDTTIHEAFEFVEDDCEISIQEERNAENIQTNENDDESPHAAQDKLTLALQNKEKETPKRDDTVQSIRVDLDRIDRLVNTVGEMVIKQAMLIDQANSAELSGQNELIKGLQELTQHTRDLQESVMAIRAQPVKTVFARLPKIVRELGLELSKDVRIEMSGENTEIDKTVIERLGEPLIHMIRNAVDHGIETPDERIKNSKNPHGTIHVSAEHRSGRIVIQIEDDGRGINREKVLEKAIKNNLISESTSLSDEEIDQLIFLPGFSTAAQVSNISGRGVGMDVVRKSIQALGGRINIQSNVGKGSCFQLMLPLTLAVLDGMLISVGEQCYIVPLINIIETIRPSLESIRNLVGGNDILQLRKEIIPLVYLHRMFSVENAITDPTKGIVVVVETEGGEKIGLVVDEMLGQQQVVIKSLEANYTAINGISGATILGNGRVALILDISALKQTNKTGQDNKAKSKSKAEKNIDQVSHS